MTSYNTNEFRSGLKIILNSEPYIIIDNEFVKPGKGKAFSRVRLRNLMSGKILEKHFRSGSSVEIADVIELNLNYLYNDSLFWYFIDKKNFEQIAADIKAVNLASKWLVKQTECILTLWNSRPISVTPPNFVDLKITKTDPGLKGDTAGTSYKSAVLITGAVVKVPLFIQVGEIIKVDTRTAEYVSRVK